jgi:hypothetical protein
MQKETTNQHRTVQNTFMQRQPMETIVGQYRTHINEKLHCFIYVYTTFRRTPH